MEEQEKKPEIDYSFFGIPLTREKRALHGCLMWFFCVFCTAIYSSINQPVKEFEINYWIFFPTIIISYNLIEKVLPWYKKEPDIIKYIGTKTFLLNMVVYLGMLFFAILSTIFLYVLLVS